MIANSSAQEPGNSSWIPDSEMSFQVIGDYQNIQQFNYFEGPNQIYIGDVEGLKVFGSSSFCLEKLINPNLSLLNTIYCMFLQLLKTF